MKTYGGVDALLHSF